MSVTVLQRSQPAEVPSPAGQIRRGLVQTSLGPVSLEVTFDMESAADIWQGLQTISPCNASQMFSAASAWVRHVVEPEGGTPVIAIGRSADGEPLFLWPFELGQHWGQTVLTWLGQRQANYNMGLYAPAAVKLSGDDVETLLGIVGAKIGAAAAVLKAQPFDWGGRRNPFAGLPHQGHPNSGYAVTLGNFDTLFQTRFRKESRRNLNRRERNLGKMGPVTVAWAESRIEKDALIEVVFAQKAVQFAKMGVPNPFTPAIRAYYRALALLDDDDPARLRLGYIRVGDTIAATLSGAICHGQLAMVLSSLADSDTHRYSPGIVLLRRQIEYACQQGLGYYDIGVGAARHKERWCDITRPLFDCFIAFRPQGRLVTVPLAGLSRVKRMVKRNRVAFSLLKILRKRAFGQSLEHDD
jgi:CelD/BcsL family acetyltransferase involved in cellulose biosynthesis